MKYIAILLTITAAALAQQRPTQLSHGIYYQSTRMLFVRQAGAQAELMRSAPLELQFVDNPASLLRAVTAE